MVYDEVSTPELIETALPELVRDALSQDTRILDVYDFEISFKNDEAFIVFKADTVFGETQISEGDMMFESYTYEKLLEEVFK